MSKHKVVAQLEIKDSKKSYSQENKSITFEDVDKRIESAKKEILTQAQIEIDKQIQIANASFITVFGIFASITSFLTIEFQFLKVLSNINQIIGFTFVLWSLLFSFNIALDYLVTSRLNQVRFQPNKYLSSVVLALLFIGIVFIICGSKPL